jgi:hypothetical protein
MRPLRDSLTAVLLAVGACLFAARSVATDVANPYFPLAVGNSWTYRCSIEGDFRLEKTLRITSMTEDGSGRVFRAEVHVKGDPRPLIQNITLTHDGTVFNSFGSNGGDRETLVTRAPKIGDQIGGWVVGAVVSLDAPARKNMRAIRIENFSIDDAEATSERRGEWRGRFYVGGIGLASEADGLGGECLLLRFHVHLP